MEAAEKMTAKSVASFYDRSIWDTIADMKTIRTFIAVPLGDEVSRNAIRLIERLRQPNDGIKWVPTDNLHLTLKFLGEVNNTEVADVCAVLQNVCADREPFELRFAGAGGLPSIERPRTLIARMEDPTESLTEIATELDREYAELGFKREPRDYTPHLTLGRTKAGSRRPSPEVMERLLRETDIEIGMMVVDRIQVIASFLDKSGPTYQVMNTVDL